LAVVQTLPSRDADEFATRAPPDAASAVKVQIRDAVFCHFADDFAENFFGTNVRIHDFGLCD
jgi:hypothetical protein